jgi:RHS repeat-associated protein
MTTAGLLKKTPSRVSILLFLWLACLTVSFAQSPVSFRPGRNLTEIDKTSGGSTTARRFVFDSLTNVVSLTDASGLPISVLTGRTIDSHYASVDSSGNVAFGIGDAINSTDGATNGSGSVTAKEAYDPYGQTTSTPPAAYPFAFTGRIPVTSNVIYFRARFYDTATGRFLSEDPADFGGGDADLYRCAGGDPVEFADPSGENQALALEWGFEGAEAGGEIGSFFGPGPGTAAGAAIGALAGAVAAVWTGYELGNVIYQNTPRLPVPNIPANWDPTTPPFPGWTWKGPDAPGGQKGGWVSPDETQSLHPDPAHPGIGPHTDWNFPGGGKGWRIFPDGRCEPKP